MPDTARITRADNVRAMEDQVTHPSGIYAATFWLTTVRGEASGIISVKYTGVIHYSFVSGETIQAVLDKYFNGELPDWREPVNDGARSRLSIESEENRYQIFVLDAENIYFSRNQVSFFISSDRYNYYGYSRSVWQDDVVGHVHLDPKPSDNTKAKMAFFKAARRDDPNKTPAAFNIQLDVEDENGDVIPISIDPDVGYPGGNS